MESMGNDFLISENELSSFLDEINQSNIEDDDQERLDRLLTNIESLSLYKVKNEDSDKEEIEIRAYYLKHIDVYVSKLDLSNDEDLESAYTNLSKIISGELSTIFEVKRFAIQLYNNLSKEFDRVSYNDSLKRKIKEIKILKQNVKSLEKQTGINLEKIKKLRNQISKDSMTLSAVFITIITFILGGTGIIYSVSSSQFLRLHTNLAIPITLILVCSLTIGISLMVMLIYSILNDNETSDFKKTLRFQMPLFIIGLSLIIMIISLIIIY